MPSKITARIVATGSYLPENILSNYDLEKMVETTNEWILERTGISERRIASLEEFPSDMGAAAAESALKQSGLKPSQIDMVLVATMTPDYLSSSTAALIQHRIKAENAAAMDIQAACSGFLYVLSVAKAYVESGMCRHVLLVASEKMSSVIDYEDRNTCILFGDGAAAAIVSAEGAGLLVNAIDLGAAGGMANLINLPAGGSRLVATHETISMRQHYLKMQGREVFKHAVRSMGAAAKQCLQKAGLTSDQIEWLVPHQANERIIDAIAKSFDIPLEKVFKTVHKYGNTSASSIGIALDELQQSQKMNSGEHILLVAFGAGLTWGAALLTKI